MLNDLPMSRRRTLIAVAGAAAALPLVTASAWAAKAGMSGDSVASDILVLGTASMKMSEMAENKASSEAVKKFAKLEVEEQKTVAELLKQSGVTMPEMKQEMQQMMQQLESAQGAQFDRTYLQMQMQGHEKLLELNKQAAEKGGMEPPVIVAKMAVCAIESHLAMLEIIEKQMMGAGSR